jgi:hypothetical protein
MKTSPQLLALLSITLLSACAPTNTTIRFISNREAVMVRNPEKPKTGDRLETLIGTRKKIFFYVTSGASVSSFLSSVDPKVGQKKAIATLLIDQHPVQLFIIQLGRPLPVNGPPTAQNKAIIASDPIISDIIGGARTEIVGVGRGSWIGTSSSSKRLFLRPLDPDLVALVDADGLDFARAQDFVLRMGSLTFEPLNR